MDFKQGDVRADGYRFLSYEKRLKRPKMRRVADELAAYVAGERTREEAVELARQWREGVYVYVEKWATPTRFEKEINGTRRKGNK
jgi:hypothetical protein